MAKFDLTDDSVVAVIGSGAGGGTLAHELCAKGIKVVLLEAGKRYAIDEFQNDEWGSFGQLSWLDKRTTSGGWRVASEAVAPLVAWWCRTPPCTTRTRSRARTSASATQWWCSAPATSSRRF